MEVGGCKNPARKDALKRHVVVTPGTALLCSRPARCTRPSGVLSHTGRATPGKTHEKSLGRRQEGHPHPQAGREPQSLTSRARSGGAFPGHRAGEATLSPLRAAPAAPLRPSALRAWRRRGPRAPDCRSPSAASGEVRAGRGGGDGGGGGESRARGRRRSPSCCRAARPKAPEPRERRFPRGARAEEGGRHLAPGRGGRSGRRGPAPRSARRAAAREASGALAVTSPARARASRRPAPPRALRLFFAIAFALAL